MGERLKDKVAIITGGTSGIGRGTVDLFLAEGAKVVVGDVQDHRGEEMTLTLGDDFLYCNADVSQEADVKNLVAETVDRFGRVDCIFNNAGFGGVGGQLDEIDMDGFDNSVGVLLKGVFLGYKYAVPVMKKQGSGSIISTASVAGLQAGFGPQVYSACKAAVAHLAKTEALELGEFNIRSNAICPGGSATPIVASALELRANAEDEFAEFMKPRLAKLQPVARSGVPHDIAEMALFLASDASSFVTGQIIAVDGGRTEGRMRGLSEAVNYEETINEYLATQKSG